MTTIRTSLLLVFLFSTLLFSQIGHRKPSLSLSDYLMSKYLGVTVTYKAPQLNKRGKPTKKIVDTQGDVVEMVIRSDGYLFKLDNGDLLSVEFYVTGGGSLNGVNELPREGTVDLQLQALKAQEFLTQSIRSIGGSGSFSSGGGGSSLSSMEKLLAQDSEGFAQGEKFRYTDRRVDKRKKGVVLVSTKGLFLDSGSPVKILLERINSGK
jgi:hypothetical protein